MRALVIGGGIGGLATGLFLHRHGIDCEVFEQSARIQELGVGINLLPHAVKELAGLGLLDELKRVGIETGQLTYANRFGQSVWSEPRGLAAGLDFPQFSIHRGKLQTVLHSALVERTDNIHTGYRFADLAQDDHSVTATFETTTRNGTKSIETHSGDVLIGADGIHSTVRAKYYPDEGPAVWDGVTLWRGALERAPWQSGRDMQIAGTMNAKFIFYPISNDVATPGKQLVNWAVGIRRGDKNSPVPEREDWNRQGKRDELVALVKEVGFDLGELDPVTIIEATDEIFEYPRCDRDPLDQWTFGRATLLGDAAHPMYPTGSNGASQAILDALALSNSLAAESDIPTALQAYEAERRPRTAKIVESNRRGGPEAVIDFVDGRAPDGFDNIDDVASREERQQIVQGYSKVAGFEKSQVNAD